MNEQTHTSASPDERPDELHEERQSLWLLTISPGIWAVHFLASYITAAVYCAKSASPDVALNGVRITIAVYTVLALIGIGATGRAGYRKHTYGEATTPHDFDTPEDRHRFLGFATLLLSALSAVATVFVAVVAAFVESCH